MARAWRQMLHPRSLAADRASVGAVVASLAGQATVVISGPATARLLGPSGRGELALLVIVTTLGATLGSAGLPSAVAYTIADRNASARSVLALVGGACLLLGIVACALSALAVLVLSAAHPSPAVALDAFLVSLWVASTIALGLALASLQGEHRFRLLNLMRPLGSALSAALLLGLFLSFHHVEVSTVLAVMVGSSVAACGATGIAAMLSLRKALVPVTVSRRSLIRYGLRSIVGASAPIEAFSIDQAIVGLVLSRQQLGLYVVGGAFNNLPSILVSGLGTIVLPRVAAEHDPVLRYRLMRKAALHTLLFVAGASLFAEVVVGFLLPFAFGNDFATAIPAARVLIVAGCLFGIRRMLVVFHQAIGRPGQTAMGELAAVVGLAIAAIALVPSFHLLGASFALVFAASVSDAYLLWALRDVSLSPTKDPGGDAVENP